MANARAKTELVSVTLDIAQYHSPQMNGMDRYFLTVEGLDIVDLITNADMGKMSEDDVRAIAQRYASECAKRSRGQ